MSQSMTEVPMLLGGDPQAIGTGAAHLRRAATEMEEWLAVLSLLRRRAMTGCAGASVAVVEALTRWGDAIEACGYDTKMQLDAIGLLAASTATDLEAATGAHRGAP